jgi:hypothetical protein
LILIGSRAAKLRLGDVFTRPCTDFDWVATKEEFDQWMETSSHKVNPTKVYELPEFHKWIVESKSTPCEFEIITPGHSSELLRDLVENDPTTIETPFGLIPNLDVLFTIKDSHKYKKFQQSSNGFWKTAIDWTIMKHMGAYVRPEYQEFSKLRQQESYAGQKHPKLNVSKDNFFKDDGINYQYNHDDIHEAVKIYDRPAYTYYLKDNQPVLCDKNKFFSVSEDIRLAGGCEEALTLSLERSYIPNKNVWTSDFIFKFALAKVASTITSGFFREYCFNNLFQIIKLYEQTSKNYCEKFEAALAAGKVRPFSGSKY